MFRFAHTVSMGSREKWVSWLSTAYPHWIPCLFPGAIATIVSTGPGLILPLEGLWCLLLPQECTLEPGQLLDSYLDTWLVPCAHIPLFCSSHKKDKFRDEIINSRWQQQSIMSSKTSYWKETLYNAQDECSVSWLCLLTHQNKVHKLLNCPLWTLKS